MPRNVRSATTVVAIIAVALAAAGCAESTGSAGGTGSSSAAGDIKIGAVLDITGAGASLGVPERQTLEMLAEQVNSGGGVNGRKIKLLIEDDQSTEAGAAKAASRLLSTDNVDLLLGASRTGPSLAMRPIAEQAKKPMLSLASNQKIVAGSTWVFKTAPNAREVLERLVGDMKGHDTKTINVATGAAAFG